MAEPSNPSRLPSDRRPVDLESTGALIERAQRGDRGALERLFARLRPPLQRWARGRLPVWARGLVDTDDLVQDSLLQTFKRIEAFELHYPGGLQGYLRQAVLNRLRDELRRRQRQPVFEEVEAVHLEATGSPLEAAIGSEEAARYEAALARLRPEDREAIVARIEMGYDYGELADALGKPSPDAARKAVQRAILRLAEELRSGRV
jgi:RNA polymerase sigma factor (sigma-70 family)